MLKKKICMLGSFGVGKTSLTTYFVSRMYRDTYHTTAGVTVDKKEIQVNGEGLMLMVWDMAGEEDNRPIKLSYLHDAAGYILVIDGLRGNTFDVALSIQDRVQTTVGELPFVVAVNKADQRENWEVQESQLAQLAARDWRLFETSAKTGEKVDDAFMTLAELILKAQQEGVDDVLTE